MLNLRGRKRETHESNRGLVPQIKPKEKEDDNVKTWRVEMEVG